MSLNPEVDILVVLYNSRRWLPTLFAGLQRISLPVAVYFLDNNSSDGTPEQVLKEIGNLPFPAYLLRSLRNNGFARGVNLLARHGSSPFIFLLNPDAELQQGCLEKLLDRAVSDPRIGISEARQMPRPHPKAVDSETHETTWCSGAAALIRRSAFEQVGGFDEQLYFMYCEDIDLSWKLWLSGWRCIYEPEAVVQHQTQDLDRLKSRTSENYFTFRNSLFLLYRFGSWSDRRILWSFLLKRLGSRAYSLKSRVLFAIAFMDHIRFIPRLLKTRQTWRGSNHSWVRFEETSLFR